MTEASSRSPVIHTPTTRGGFKSHLLGQRQKCLVGQKEVIKEEICPFAVGSGSIQTTGWVVALNCSTFICSSGTLALLGLRLRVEAVSAAVMVLIDEFS